MYQRKDLCQNKKHGYEYYGDSFKKLKSIFEKNKIKIGSFVLHIYEK
jgi:hypothetical protein